MENFEKILLGYSGFIFVSYILYVIYKFGFLNAISASYYRLKKISKSLFTFFIWSISFPIIIVGVNETSLMFFAGVFLSFVGAAPHYEEKLEGKIHYIGAIGGIGFGLLTLIFIFHLYILSGIFLIFILYARLFRIKNYFWWVEIAAFIIIYVGLIFFKINS